LVSEQNCLAGSPQVELATTGRPYAAFTKSGTHAIGFFSLSSKHLSSASPDDVDDDDDDDDDAGAAAGCAGEGGRSQAASPLLNWGPFYESVSALFVSILA
jgi:hypothetical protein